MIHFSWSLEKVTDEIYYISCGLFYSGLKKFSFFFTFLKPAPPMPFLLDTICPSAPADIVKLSTTMSL